MTNVRKLWVGATADVRGWFVPTLVLVVIGGTLFVIVWAVVAIFSLP